MNPCKGSLTASIRRFLLHPHPVFGSVSGSASGSDAARATAPRPLRRHLRTLCLAALLAAPPLARLAAQTSDDAQHAADSVVRGDDRLFDDPMRPYTALDSAIQRAPLPTGRHARFPVSDDMSTEFLRLEDAYSIISYDRADGLYVGAGGDLPERAFIDGRVQGWLTLGYGFGSHYWQAGAGLTRDVLSEAAPLRISLEAHLVTDTRDAWKMGPIENTFFATLAGIDTRDYFQRRGFSVGLETFLDQRTGIGAEFRYDSYRSSRLESQWSIFGPKQPFRDVPAVTEGPLRSILFTGTTDYITRRSINSFRYGAEARAEFGIDSRRFSQYILDARVKALVIPRFLWLNGRLRAASSTGDLPLQRMFTLGGFGTLPGYPQNSMEGDRMFLLQTEVVLALFDGVPFSVPDIEISRKGGGVGPSGTRIIIENNLGGVGLPGPDATLLGGFPAGLKGYKHSMGLYLGSPDGRFRIGAAIRTDVDASPIFVIRFAPTF